MAKRQFKSESKRLLDLMINSIYTHKEIFLREIISNASDAIDKLCFIALTDDKLGMTRSDFKITLKPDKENRTLTITDNGIGMDKDDLENNLGTIASSGSYKFKQNMTEKNDDIDIIGQFGVGFYSAFMVAKKITVNTKKYGSDIAYCWQSSGADGYTIKEIDKKAIGTEIILEMKDNTDDENYDQFLEQYKIQELVPEHFRFVKGIVDTADLSLNISREMLQHDRHLLTIAQNIEKKIKNELTAMLNNERENYEKFFAAFGRQLKYGVVSDYGMHKEELQDLLMFYSSTEKKLVTLSEYVDRMKEDQKYIYFATGESTDAIDALPQTELLRSKGYEILYCTEETDEFTLQTLMQYKDKKFCSAANDDLGIENDENKEDEKDSSALLTFVKETLGDKVSEVTASKKLVSHPVCLTAKGGISFEMEKYFNAVQPGSGMKAQRVLELNINHPAVKAMESLVQTDIDKAKKYAEVLYCQALLIAGLPIENPSEYTDLVCSLM